MSAWGHGLTWPAFFFFFVQPILHFSTVAPDPGGYDSLQGPGHVFFFFFFFFMREKR